MRDVRTGSSYLVLLFALLQVTPAAAQTVIISDTGAGFDSGTAVSTSVNKTTITGGTLAGGNLFHSFAQFDLAQGDIAQWVRGSPDGASIAHVINRVTGGAPSGINGTLRIADMPNASFYFSNPAGVLFGQGAIIDLPGAAYFSTGESVHFADGRTFSTVTPDGSAFSSASPQAFGFLGGQRDIVLAGISATLTRPDTRLFLSGANIAITGEEFEAGSIALTALGSAQVDLSLDDPLRLAGLGRIEIGDQDAGAVILATSVRIAAQDVVLFNSIVQSQPILSFDPGIEVRAGDVSLNGANISSVTLEDADAGAIGFEAGALTLDNSVLLTQTFGAGDAGSVTVVTDSVSVSNFSFIATQAVPGATGFAGDILIDTGSLALDLSELSSSAFGAGDAGSISVLADSISLTSGSYVVSESRPDATGNAGEITFAAGSLNITNSQVFSSTFSGGDAGLVSISGTDIMLKSESFIGSDAQFGSTGSAGSVTIDAASLKLDRSDISSSTFGPGDAGRLSITADSVTLLNGTVVGSQTGRGAAGNAGSVFVDADLIQMTFGSKISSRAEGGSTGDGGPVTIFADVIDVSEFSSINAASEGPGKGGSLDVFANVIRLESRGFFSTNALNDGDGGSIVIRSRFPETGVKAAIMLDVFSTIFSITQEGLGNAGSIDIDAGSITLLGGSTINTEARVRSGGDAGRIQITADTVRIQDGSAIISVSSGQGDAGSVMVTADDLSLDTGLVSSSTYGSGDAGTVTVRGINRDNIISLSNSSEISSLTAGSGNGGLVDIEAGAIHLASESAISSQTEFAVTGAGGNVRIVAGRLLLDSRSQVSSATAGSGDAGTVLLTIDSLAIEDGTITTSTIASGNAGLLDIPAGAIRIGPGGYIVSASAAGASGNAGDVRISTPSLMSQGGSIQALSAGSGTAGSITLQGRFVELADGAEITTNSDFGPAGDINLFFPADGQLSLTGVENVGVITTTSGPNTGGRITISDPYVIVSNGGSILALGEISGANVRIASDYLIRSADRSNLLSVNGDLLLDSQFSDLSAGTEAPDIDFLDASSVLSSQCAAVRASGQTSRFSSRLTGPYAPVIESASQHSAAGDRKLSALSRLAPCG